MDCTTFQDREIDALYGELDAAGSAAMVEHAATCASCAARFERLRGTRGLVLSVAIEAVPDDFEARIMSAVDAGLAKRVPAAAPVAKAEGGARIFKFMARPAFAVAATFVLVIGGAALLMTQNRAKAPAAAFAESSPVASPVARVPSAADEPAPVEGAVAVAEATATAAPPPASPMASAFAFREPAKAAPTTAMPPAAVAAAAPAPAKPSKASAPTEDDRAFAAAKALFSSGRYAEALPRFEALKATTPEADLYAARCIAKTQGCAAAAPRFDTAAQTNAGTEAGNRATLEGAKCYQASGELAEARKRYKVARDEDSVSLEATQALDALDKKAAGAPGAGVHTSPKAMPSPAPMAPSK